MNQNFTKLSSSVERLLEHWRNNSSDAALEKKKRQARKNGANLAKPETVDSFTEARESLKAQFYGRVALADDLLTLRFPNDRHKEFKLFIETAVLKFAHVANLLRGGKATDSENPSDIENFLRTYRRYNQKKSEA